MSYPTLPFALVHYLAQISKERSKLRKGPRHVSIMAHHDKGVRSRRFEVVEDSHWTEVLQSAIAMYSEGEIDTMTFMYPTNGNEPVDIGVIVERGREPMVVEWTYSPEFKIVLLESGDVVTQVTTTGVGVQEVLGLMNREGNPSIRPGVAPTPAIPAALAAPSASPINPDYVQDR